MAKLSAVVLALAMMAGLASARVSMESSISSFKRFTWAQGARISADDTIDVVFVIKTCPMKRAKLEEKFWAVSTPGSKEYKKYLSLEEVAGLLHPLPDDPEGVPAFAAVAKYLEGQEGLVAPGTSVRVTKTRDLVSATLSAAKAEALFGVELFHFSPVAAGYEAVDQVRASGPYSLPDGPLAEHVSIVDKLLRLPHLAPAKVGSAATTGGDDEFEQCFNGGATACNAATTPAVLKSRYGLPDPKANITSGSTMACTEFQLQGIKDNDLANFGDACGVGHVKVDVITGQGGSLLAGVEALLDVEYIEAVAAPIPLEVINSISYSLFDWSTSLNNDDSPAWVQSVSYGNDEVQQTSSEYMQDCNTQFMMNGARGLSVLFASGDQGVWGRTGHDATGVFHPDFPAGSPYITAVGGTDFAQISTLGEEKTWTDGGGGFSNAFATPDYQAAAVAGYLASGVALPDEGQYNATGRAYPDVAALAGQTNGYCVAAKGKFLKVGGTSAACPVFAGTVALLNDELLGRGEAPMGFLNPWIYGVAGPAGVFFDVVQGTNNAGFGSGFTATAGWDPATGFGTPNYPAMLALVLGGNATTAAA